MRKVVSMSEVAHFFANKTQEEARNSQGNFYFDGDSIYSYGRHFCIAKHVRNEKGETAVLVSTRSYSSSTSNHQSYVSDAINHLDRIFCPDADNGKSQNYSSWLSLAEEILLGLTKARKPAIYLNQLSQLKKTIERYNEFFGYDMPETLTAVFAVENKEQYNGYAVAKNEAHKKEIERAAKELKGKNKKELIKWRKGELNRIFWRNGMDYLRLNSAGDVETSQQVKIPRKVALSFYTEILAIVAKGGCLNCGFKFMRTYDVLEIDKKYIRVGCHRIAMDEIKRTVKALNAQTSVKA